MMQLTPGVVETQLLGDIAGEVTNRCQDGATSRAS